MGVERTEVVANLEKTWHLQKKPGVRTASLFTLAVFEFIVVVQWPGLTAFALGTIGILVIVVLSVALVDAGGIWDERLFNDLYRPEGQVDDHDNKLPPGAFLGLDRPLGGLFPPGPKLQHERDLAARSLNHPEMDGIYDASRKYLKKTRVQELQKADEPLELSKGVRALLAPLVAMLGVGVIGIGLSLLLDGDPSRWVAAAVAAPVLWTVFAYVFIHRRYEHMTHLYSAVVAVHDEENPASGASAEEPEAGGPRSDLGRPNQ